MNQRLRSANSRALNGNGVSRRVSRAGSSGFTLLEMLIVIGVILLLTAITVTVITGLTARAEIRDTENTMQLMEKALSEWELAMGRRVTYGINDEPCDQNERYELPQLINGGVAANDADALRESDILWSILSRASSSREIMARVNPDALLELTPPCHPSFNPNTPVPSHLDVTDLNHLEGDMGCRIGYRFLDAWGNPIIAVMPGRRSNAQCGDDSYCVDNMVQVNGHCPDDDLTIRTPFENRFGVASNGRIFFVSAGPSGRFGDLRLSVSLNSADHDELRRAADNIYSHEIIIEEGRPQ